LFQYLFTQKGRAGVHSESTTRKMSSLDLVWK